MLHNGDRAGENDIGVDETAELHGIELSAELQPEALPADHARHAEQRQRQEVERVVAAQNARGNGRYIIHGEVGLRVGEIALAAVRGGKVIDRHDRPADGKQSPADAREQAADDGDRRRNADGGLLFRQQQIGAEQHQERAEHHGHHAQVHRADEADGRHARRRVKQRGRQSELEVDAFAQLPRQRDRQPEADGGRDRRRDHHGEKVRQNGHHHDRRAEARDGLNKAAERCAQRDCKVYHNRFPLISFSEKMTAGISADGHCMLFPESCQDFARLICRASCRDRPP